MLLSECRGQEQCALPCSLPCVHAAASVGCTGEGEIAMQRDGRRGSERLHGKDSVRKQLLKREGVRYKVHRI